MERFLIPTPHFDITYSPSPIYGYYVYEWLDHYKPFYVGMGTQYRAWAQHHPITEERKEQSTKFRVRIVQHRLTKKLAHKFERMLIKRYVSQGISLTNIRIPQC